MAALLTTVPSLLLIFVAVFFCVPNTHALPPPPAQQQYVPTGTFITSSSVAGQLRTDALPQATPRRRYTLSRNLKLSDAAAGVVADLHADTERTDVHASPRTTVRVDGMTYDYTPSVTVRRGRTPFSVTTSSSSGGVLHVDGGRGVSLYPAARGGGSSQNGDVLLLNSMHQDGNGGKEIMPSHENETMSDMPSYVMTCVNQTNRLEVQTAIYFDSSYCAKFDNANETIDSLYDMVRQASLAFEEHTCLSLTLVHVEGWCNAGPDPFNTLDGLPFERIVFDARTWLEVARADVRQDIAMLVTGFADPAGVVQASFQDGACTRGAKYGWQGVQDWRLLARNVGALMGARTDTEGIMAAMHGGTDDHLSHFSQTSVKQLLRHVDRGRAPCVRPPRTCEERRPVRSMNCSSYERLGVVSTRVGDVAVSGRRAFGAFQLRLFAPQAVTEPDTTTSDDGETRTRWLIRGVSVVASVGRVLNAGDLPAPMRVGRRRRGLRIVEVMPTPGDIARPTGTGTCCGNDVNVNLLVHLTREMTMGERGDNDNNRKRESDTAFGHVVMPMLCHNVCKDSGLPNGIVVPMNGTQRCSVCIN